MAEKMRAAVVEEFGKPMELKEVDVPEPGPGEVLVRVETCGVCHSDLHTIDGDWPRNPPVPIIPGHEAAGTVAKLGHAVTGLKEGDRVGVPWINSACGTCDCCLTGWENLCRYQKGTGFAVNGGFADYVLAGADYVGRLPDDLSCEAASPILCAGLTTYKALKESEARAGDWVAVSGVGGLGHLAIEYAKFMGCKVVAIDIADDKLELAKQVGADMVVNAADDAVRTIRKATGGVRAVIVTAASTEAYNQALAMLGARGVLVLVAMAPGEMQVPIVSTVSRGLTIRGSAVGNRKELQEVLNLASAGSVTADVTLVPFEEVNDVVDEMRRGELKGRKVLKLV